MIETVRRMVTSCPECDTHFYVQPEQLAARKGFVRCGHCQHRFNALEFMLPERELQIDFSSLEKVNKVFKHSTRSPVEEPVETYTPTPLADAITSMPLNRNAIVAPPVLEEIEQTEEIVSSETVLSPTEQIESHLREDQAQAAEALADVESETPPIANTNLLEAMQDNYEILQTEADTPIVVVKGVTSSNTDFAKKDSFKQKKSKNAAISLTYSLLATVLILFAAAQTLYYCRTAITSQIPQTKPYFEQACLAIGCVIELPKDITKINIDDSDLKEDATYQGLIRVSATIINQAAVNLAYPNLELTLTDEDNKPLLRRIFKPSEYLEKKAPVELGLPSNQETYVNLNVSAAGSAVVGYRLLPSYE